MRLLASAVYLMVIFLLSFIECSRAKSTCQDNDNDCHDLSVQHGLSHYTDNLLQGSKMIEIAYYALIAADLNFTDLRIETSRLALDMVRLQQKSMVVVTKTKTHLQNMLNKIKIFLSFVDHDHQLQALMMLNLTDKDVKEISQSAAELQSELNRLATETFRLFTVAKRANAENLENLQTLEHLRQEYEDRKLKNEKILQTHRSEVLRLTELQAKYKWQEINKNAKKGRFVNVFVNFMTRALTGHDLYPPEHYEQQARLYKDLHDEVEETEAEEIKKLNKVMEDVLRFSGNLRLSKNNIELSNAAVRSFGYAIKSLLHMATIMQDMETFWIIRAQKMEMISTAAHNLKDLMEANATEVKGVLADQKLKQMMNEHIRELEMEIHRCTVLEKSLGEETLSKEIEKSFTHVPTKEEATKAIPKLARDLQYLIDHDRKDRNASTHDEL